MFQQIRRWLARDRAAPPPVAIDTRPAPADAAAEPARTGPVIVIDVRTASEFRISAIQGAVNLPLAQLAGRIGEVATDKTTPLVLYCASGARSSSGCQVLRQLGFSDVRNAGGLYRAAEALQMPLR